jgi:uncharacterized protein (DUF1330 family)
MNRYISLALAMLASGLFGAAAVVSVLNAQGISPGAYAIVDISEVTDPSLFRQQLLPKVTPAALASSGGKYLVRTDTAISLDGTPPQRFIIIAFDSMDKAKAWSSSASQKEIDALRMKSMRSRQFLVEGFSN